MLETTYDLEADGFTILRNVFPEDLASSVTVLLRHAPAPC